MSNSYSFIFLILIIGYAQGYVAIPKSVSQGRIKANADLYGFELSKEELATLHGLNESASLQVHYIAQVAF